MSYRARLRPLKRGVAAMLQRGWGLGFRAAAYTSEVHAAALQPVGGQRILIVAPHPDDEAMGCAGTAMLHVGAGDLVYLAVATDGRRSKVLPDPSEVARQRKREAETAAGLMQVEHLGWIGLPEGEWQVPELTLELATLLREIRPNVVYAPSLIDFHPEHLKVAHALGLALQSQDDAHIRVRVYQIQVPLTALLANLVADVSSLRSRSEAVLGAYTSQAASIQCSHRQRRYAAERHGISLHAEEFWEMPVSRYIRLHHACPSQGPQAFRGLRYFPLTDPLAYLVGREERRALRLQDLA